MADDDFVGKSRFDKMLRAIPDLISMHDEDMNILYSNWRGWGAVDPEYRVEGSKCYETYRGFHSVCPDCLAKGVLKSGEPIQREVVLEDGTWVDLRVIPVHEPDGTCSSFVEWVRDISQRKAFEEALRENEERLRTVFECSLDCILLLDGDHRVQMVNREDDFALGTPFFETVVEEDQDRVKVNLDRVVRQGVKEQFEYRSLDGQGVEHSYSSVVAPIRREGKVCGSLVSSRDVSEEVKLRREKLEIEQQYFQSQKVECVGRLAGGVAHDLNNLLTPILGYGEILQDDLPDDGLCSESLREIINAGERAKHLVRQLLAFGRKQQLEFSPIEVNEMISNFENLLRRTIREDIRLTLRQEAGIARVNADLGQLEQVLLNLAVNASDAMPQGGELSIETVQVKLEERDRDPIYKIPPGEYILLQVSDTGHGMDEETKSKIFEPFFTTKGQDGTGLGLATVYGIIKQHEGYTWVYSEPGVGTTFKIYLPVLDEDLAAQGIPSSVSDRSSLSTMYRKGSERILLVEDNEQVRRLTKAMLERLSYEVIVAADGDAALALLDEDPSSVQLLLTDVVMPGMNGKELFKRARRLKPDLRVLYMSGYTATVIAYRGVLDEGAEFIAKPFTTTCLAAKIRAMLDKD